MCYDKLFTLMVRKKYKDENMHIYIANSL